jgi:NAD(P)-dependent dehydrogenase (short-subunit alcohol dehydrogenase family)
VIQKIRIKLTASNVAKAGLLGFPKPLFRELSRDNIPVNFVLPGLIGSPRNKRYFSGLDRIEATGKNLVVDGGMSRGL